MKKVPLKADYSHDVRAMLAANPNAGVYYVCNPNNPSGTMTPMADIEWLVNNKPAGAMVVIDEAYIHWTRDYPNNTATHLARANKDVLIMRTFSKVFGMAGMRVGYFMGRPDIVAKIKMFDNGALGYQLPAPSAACATASITANDMIEQRRKEMMANRTMTEDFLRKRGFKVIGPSEANMIMVDWKTKTAKQMKAAFLAQGVQIARVFPAWPTVSRVYYRLQGRHGGVHRRLQQGGVGVRTAARNGNKASLSQGDIGTGRSGDAFGNTWPAFFIWFYRSRDGLGQNPTYGGRLLCVDQPSPASIIRQ